MTTNNLNLKRINDAVDINNKQLQALQVKHNNLTQAQLQAEFAPAIIKKVEKVLQQQGLHIREVHGYIVRETDVVLTCHLFGTEAKTKEIVDAGFDFKSIDSKLVEFEDHLYLAPHILTPTWDQSNTFKIVIMLRSNA